MSLSVPSFSLGFDRSFHVKIVRLMHLSAAISGVDPGDIRGNSAGFADFCRQFLALDGDIGPPLHFRGEIHVERPEGFVTSPPS